MTPERHDRLGDFTTDKRVITLALMALPIGAIATLVAWALVWLIGAITNLSFYGRLSADFTSPAGHHLGWLVVLVPAAGGLLIGLMSRYGSEKIRGHGIPEALEAILIGRSRIEAKVAILKPLSSAISIGTGGPFGAEGPIIMTGGAFGSLFAGLFRVSPGERKVLLTAGAAAGMSAIFNSPVAAVLVAVELLLFEWKPRSFIPVALASAVAAGLRVPLLGGGAVFPVTAHAAMGAGELSFALLAGIVAGIGSSLLTKLVYGFEDLFEHLPFHWMWWPVIGGVGVGLLGYFDPRIFGVGYDLIRSILNGQIIGAALWSLLLLKSVAWAFALGSGTSGGVLAPLLIIGGLLGGIEAQWIPAGDPSLWAMVGMAAMMGGTMRAPLTAMVFTLELTHDLSVFTALLIACAASYAVTVLLMRRSILTEKIARHGHHLHREYSANPLQMRRVGEVMVRETVMVPASMMVSDLAKWIADGHPWLTHHHAVMIAGTDGKLAGIITRGDVVRVVQENAQDVISVVDAGSIDLVVAYPDESVQQALTRMVEEDIGRLPVVSRDNPGQLVGYIGRSSVLDALMRQIREETIQEPGWLEKISGRMTESK